MIQNNTIGKIKILAIIAAISAVAGCDTTKRSDESANRGGKDTSGQQTGDVSQGAGQPGQAPGHTPGASDQDQQQYGSTSGRMGSQSDTSQSAQQGSSGSSSGTEQKGAS